MLDPTPKGYAKVFPDRVFSKEKSINEPFKKVRGVYIEILLVCYETIKRLRGVSRNWIEL